MRFTLSVDHRRVDGAAAAHWVREFHRSDAGPAADRDVT
ncbi:2-oxo acid dehydrogenase subunit E2 [Streptomyces sp. NPDC002574]